MHVIVAVAPVGWNTLIKTMYSFGYEKKVKIAALFYHSPALISPPVGVLKKKIAGKAKINYSVTFTAKLIFSAAIFLDRKIKGFVFYHL